MFISCLLEEICSIHYPLKLLWFVCKVALNLGVDTVICLHILASEYFSPVLFITNMEYLQSVCQATCSFFILIEAGYRVSLSQLPNLPSTHHAQEPKSRKYRRPGYISVPYMSLASLATCFSERKQIPLLFAVIIPKQGKKDPCQNAFPLVASLKKV